MSRPVRLTLLLPFFCLLAGTLFGQSAPVSKPARAQQGDPGDPAYTTAQNYLIVFYARWFTFRLGSPPAPSNQWIGPDHMSPTFGNVVAPNDDTLYVSSFMDLSAEPVIITVPPTTVTYSLLVMDGYANVYNTNAQSPTALSGIPPGTYGLTAPGWQGTLPAGVTPVPLPLNWMIWLIRADKYSKDGQDQTMEADMFRRSLLAAPLSEYLQNPQAGAANIIPVAYYSPRYKVIADDLIANDPINFLTQLQNSVKSPNTPPLSSYEQQLSDQFDSLFSDQQNWPDIGNGAQAGLSAILARYQANKGTTNWISFTDIGAWGTDYLARSATTEYLDLSNTHATAAYYHAFEDANGDALDTTVHSEYVLTFAADQIPQARRFWSLTMYTPDSITLVSNDINKYLVASYTPGLQYDEDGSVSIYISPTLPPGVPQSNWLPAPQGQFDVVLRDYGPIGSIADNTYTPPGIVPSP
jgi:hypothetical protein